ncbi:MAG: hypothetical protein WBG86_17985, partial [Polyangiales bacterium]
MDSKRLAWTVVLGLVVATAGCGDDTGGMAGSGGTAGAGGSMGQGGFAIPGGADGGGGTGGVENTPPEATILSPASDTGMSNMDFVYDGFDDDLGLWYKDLTLEGLG